jgi:hypothetical protein
MLKVLRKANKLTDIMRKGSFIEGSSEYEKGVETEINVWLVFYFMKVHECG